MWGGWRGVPPSLPSGGPRPPKMACRMSRLCGRALTICRRCSRAPKPTQACPPSLHHLASEDTCLPTFTCMWLSASSHLSDRAHICLALTALILRGSKQVCIGLTCAHWHAGFLQQFAGVCRPDKPEKNMSTVLEQLSGGRTPTRVLCCGHSLGGALATLGECVCRPFLATPLLSA